MLVKDKKSGEVESLRYGPAMDAVTAGTHEIVVEGDAPEADEPKVEKPVKADKPKAETKA